MPASTPKEVVTKINAAIVKATRSPDVIEKFEKSNIDPAEPNTPGQYEQEVQKQMSSGPTS